MVNRNFCSRKRGGSRGHMMFLSKGGPLNWGRLKILKGVDTMEGTMQKHYIYENFIPSCHNQVKMFDLGKHLQEED